MGNMNKYGRFKKGHVKKDPVTGEYFFNGKWYDHYPAKEVEDFEGAVDEYWERKLDEKRDTIGKGWDGGHFSLEHQGIK